MGPIQLVNQCGIKLRNHRAVGERRGSGISRLSCGSASTPSSEGLVGTEPPGMVGAAALVTSGLAGPPTPTGASEAYRSVLEAIRRLLLAALRSRHW